MPEINSGDTAWLLVSSALVLLMTPGLAFFYGGLVRRKNAAATIMQSFMCIGLVGVVWVLWGYSLAFSKGNAFIGDFAWFGLNGVSAAEAHPGYGATVPHQAYMIFQAMFAIITPALITGAFAERMKFSAFMIFIVLWLTLVYVPVAHWVWALNEDASAAGWLGQRGALDFAGGTVVHINAGVAALAAAAIVFGRRKGYGTEPMLPHNIPFVVLGAGLLWFGWFGFNAGSAITAGGRATSAFVVTNTATAAGVLAWVIACYALGKKPSVAGAASGAVAGLVAITPASGFVGPMPALAIGAGAGVFCYLAVQLVSKLRVDDALAVFGVHGIGGIWGALATGLFAGIGTAGVYALPEGVGVLDQLGKQVVAIAATFVWSLVITTAILLALKYTIGVKVKDEEEAVGLDLSQHGEEAYIDA